MEAKEKLIIEVGCFYKLANGKKVKVIDIDREAKGSEIAIRDDCGRLGSRDLNGLALSNDYSIVSEWKDPVEPITMNTQAEVLLEDLWRDLWTYSDSPLDGRVVKDRLQQMAKDSKTGRIKITFDVGE